MINTEMFTRESVEKLVDTILLDKDTFNEELVYPIKDVNNREVIVVVEHSHSYSNNNDFFHVMVLYEFTFDGEYYDWDSDTYDNRIASDDDSKNELFQTINSLLNL